MTNSHSSRNKKALFAEGFFVGMIRYEFSFKTAKKASCGTSTLPT